MLGQRGGTVRGLCPGGTARPRCRPHGPHLLRLRLLRCRCLSCSDVHRRRADLDLRLHLPPPLLRAGRQAGRQAGRHLARFVRSRNQWTHHSLRIGPSTTGLRCGGKGGLAERAPVHCSGPLLWGTRDPPSPCCRGLQNAKVRQNPVAAHVWQRMCGMPPGANMHTGTCKHASRVQRAKPLARAANARMPPRPLHAMSTMHRMAPPLCTARMHLAIRYAVSVGMRGRAMQSRAKRAACTRYTP